MFMYICMCFFSFSLVYTFAYVYLFVPVNQKFFDVFLFLDRTNQTMLKLTYCNLHHHLILTLIGNIMINQAETDFSPLQVSDLPQKYQVDQAEQLLQWLGNLADPAEPVRSGYQTGCKGVRHQTKKKSGLTVSMMSNTLIF